MYGVEHVWGGNKFCGTREPPHHQPLRTLYRLCPSGGALQLLLAVHLGLDGGPEAPSQPISSFAFLFSVRVSLRQAEAL